MLTQYALNHLADAMRRAQSFAFPATCHWALFTVLPTRSTAGTELAASGYARIALAASLANWSGTQGAGTTAASSGSGVNADKISINADMEFHAAAPAAWSGIVGIGYFDAGSGGNLWEFGPIVDLAGNPITRSFFTGERVALAAGNLTARWA
jgi:hypothetical protein